MFNNLKEKRMKILQKSIVALACLASSVVAQAAVVRIDETAFNPQAGLITFSEMSTGTQNPVYQPVNYGGGAGAPVVSFGGYFTGQTMGTVGTCPAGAALSGCVIGTPTGTLSLNAASPHTAITSDGSNPTSPVLSGQPTFNGPIAVLFDVDLSGVGLTGGYFNAIGGTAITAFARDGSVLGSVSNQQLGIEFLGLATQDGSAKIAGLLFSLVGSEPAGFAIDNLRFGTAAQVTVPDGNVPEPGSVALVGLALAAMTGLRLKRRN
jgi:hypothetical protein